MTKFVSSYISPLSYRLTSSKTQMRILSFGSWKTSSRNISHSISTSPSRTRTLSVFEMCKYGLCPRDRICESSWPTRLVIMPAAFVRVESPPYPVWHLQKKLKTKAEPDARQVCTISAHKKLKGDSKFVSSSLHPLIRRARLEQFSVSHSRNFSWWITAAVYALAFSLSTYSIFRQVSKSLETTSWSYSISL